MSKSGAKYAAAIDDVAGSPTENTVVQLNHVSPDSEYDNEPVGNETTKGIDLHAGDNGELTLAFNDSAGLDQLKQWQERETTIKLIVLGLQENILWYEPTPMRMAKNFNFQARSRNTHQLTMRSSKNAAQVHSGVNLLYLVDDAHAADTYDLVIPIEGATLTLSADGGTGNLEILALDAAGTTLASDSVAAASRASVDLKLPANTKTVRVNLPAGHSEPALRTDGSDEYKAG